MKSIVSPTASIVFASELRRDGLRIFRFSPLDIWGELWYPEEVIEQTFKSLTPLTLLMFYHSLYGRGFSSSLLSSAVFFSFSIIYVFM